MSVAGVGVDLVHVPSFEEQLGVEGSRFADVFAPGERRAARLRTGSGGRQLAARWAAKEAVIKAWSATLFGEAPVTGDEALREIEVELDAWDRPRIRLRGLVAEHLAAYECQVSLSHDGEYAIAYVVLSHSGSH